MLHREVLKDPSLFADLISWAFKRSDGQTDEIVNEQKLYIRSSISYDILSGLRGLPGQGEGGVVVPEVLETWISEARRLCKERGGR